MRLLAIFPSKPLFRDPTGRVSDCKCMEAAMLRLPPVSYTGKCRTEGERYAFRRSVPPVAAYSQSRRSTRCLCFHSNGAIASRIPAHQRKDTCLFGISLLNDMQLLHPAPCAVWQIFPRSQTQRRMWIPAKRSFPKMSTPLVRSQKCEHGATQTGETMSACQKKRRYSIHRLAKV
jgi:hypothetical protein